MFIIISIFIVVLFVASSVSRAQKKKRPQEPDQLEEEVHGFTVHDGLDVLGLTKTNKVGDQKERIEHEPIQNENEINRSILAVVVLFILIVIWRVFFRDLIF